MSDKLAEERVTSLRSGPVARQRGPSTALTTAVAEQQLGESQSLEPSNRARDSDQLSCPLQVADVLTTTADPETA